jgi:hypothetical protein
MNLVETLENSKQKIITVDKWFPGYKRATRDMGGVFADRVCNCMITAIENSPHYSICLDLLCRAIKEFDSSVEDPVVVSHWNDTHSHEEVLQVYDIAIKLAQEFDNGK